MRKMGLVGPAIANASRWPSFGHRIFIRIVFIAEERELPPGVSSLLGVAETRFDPRILNLTISVSALLRIVSQLRSTNLSTGHNARNYLEAIYRP